MKTRYFPVFASLLLAVFPSLGQAGDDVSQWLERMSAAMSQMDYQGTFIYIRDNDMESMRITHVVDEQGSLERLVSVSGEPGEILRDADGVRWISGDDGRVLADSDANRSFFPELPLGDPAQAAVAYRLELKGKQRIAGHTGQRLNIIPKDKLRYGYSIWLEVRSGLLLQWELTGIEGETLAQLMFTELKMGSEVDRHELRPLKRTRVSENDASSAMAVNQVAVGSPSWKSDSLPTGFRLASQRQKPLAKGASFEHLVYSDGLATVSAYIESGQQESSMSMGLSKMGTTHAFTRMSDGVLITVLGDVPAVTVRKISESLRPVTH
jgi:sigma-E factor negative regulatory protein RseB